MPKGVYPNNHGKPPRIYPAEIVEQVRRMYVDEGTDPELDLTRGEQLRILGNGVVPQQAYRAFEIIQETT